MAMDKVAPPSWLAHGSYYRPAFYRQPVHLPRARSPIVPACARSPIVPAYAHDIVPAGARGALFAPMSRPRIFYRPEGPRRPSRTRLKTNEAPAYSGRLENTRSTGSTPGRPTPPPAQPR